jgi:pimeloyl-ACP methyl ester carboxylesterase
VSSDIPTLIFAGDLDPIHPPAWGKLASETLSNSQYFEFPNYGHGVFGEGRDGGNCSEKILDAFLSDPNAEVDASCIAGLKPFFLTR